MKSLTVNNIKKVEGFVRRVEYDFKDDGNSFTGWSYKGLPISQLRSEGRTYFTFRWDYLNEHSEIPVLFTFDDWFKTKGYCLCEKWNGCVELPSIEELAAAGDQIIAEIKEMNEKVSKEVVNVKPILDKLAEEECYFAMQYAKMKLVDLFDERFSDYDVRDLCQYAKRTNEYVKTAQQMRLNIKDGKFSAKQVRELSQRLDKWNYVSSNTKNCCWVEEFFGIVDRRLRKETAEGENKWKS